MRTPFARQLSAFGSGPKARDASASELRSAVNLWAPGGERLRSRYGTRIVGAGPVDLLPAGRTLVVNGTTADADRVIAASGDDIYVGSEDVFHGFWVSPSVSITPTEHYRLQVEYWNGTEWTELDVLDGTAQDEGATFIQQSDCALLLRSRQQRQLCTEFLLHRFDKAFHRPVQRRKPHTSYHRAFPHQRNVCLVHLTCLHDRCSERMEEWLNRVNQRVTGGHDADWRATLTLTNVAPWE